jgi:hypothetical protein
MLTLSRKIMVSASRESVRTYLRELNHMTDYEQKVDSVRVTGPEGNAADIDVTGKFMGLPWKGTFSVSFTADGGYRSSMTRGPLKKMTGGFHLRPVAGGTIVTHDEQYQLPLPLRPLSPFIRRWIDRSMEVELRVIKEGAERLNRKLQLEDAESQQLRP